MQLGRHSFNYITICLIMDCPFSLNGDDLWQCSNKGCEWVYPRKSEKPPRRNCTADIPRRTESEILEIIAEHCEPCEVYHNGKCFDKAPSCARGKDCRMLAERSCPAGKFGGPKVKQTGES